MSPGYASRRICVDIGSRSLEYPHVVLVAATAVPFLGGTLGVAYLATALGLGAVFLWLALRLRRDATPRRASVLFHYSLLYLALVFTAMALDVAL